MRSLLRSGLLLTLAFSAQATDVPQAVTYLGRVLESDGITPLEKNNVLFKVQILGAVGSCVLYEETFLRNMAGTEGHFSLPIGLGTNTSVSALEITEVFDNTNPLVGASSCNYSPLPEDARRLRLSYNDGVTNVVIPQDQIVRSVPYALNSQTLQGLKKDKFLQVTTSTTQAKLNDLLAKYSALIGLADGTNTSYVSSSQLPINAGVVDLSGGGLIVPSVPASPDSAVNKTYSDSTVAGKTVDLTGLLNGQTLVWNTLENRWKPTSALYSVVGGVGISAAIVAGVATVGLATNGVVPGTYTKITVDAYGRVTLGSSLSASDLPSSGILGSGTVADGSILFGNSNDDYSVIMRGPSSLAGDVTFVLPGTTGNAGDFLTTDGSGHSSWSRISFQMLKNAVGNSQIPNNCTSSQTYVYSVMLDQFVCTDVVVSAGSISGLGTGASKDVPASGNAAASQLVLGNDTRLSDSRTPTGAAGGDLTGTYPNPSLTATGVTAGTYAKVQVDAKGRVLAGSALSDSDIPTIDYSKITGKPTTLAGHGITDAVPTNGSVASLNSGLEADRPAAGTVGRVYMATDTQKIYIDTGSSWLLMASGSTGGGSVTSVTAGNGLTGGTITTTGTIAVDTGTTANKIVQLDSNGKLPAVDGSALVSLPIPFSNFQVIDTAGTSTWTVPANVKKIFVEVWGAGGGGSGSGYGGGAGAYGSWFSAVTPGASLSYKVGAGGSGGANNASGSAGEASTFNGVNVNGGAAGTTSAGGVGGSATVSTSINGIPGSNGAVWQVQNVTFIVSFVGYLSGSGGSSPRGGNGGLGSMSSSVVGGAGLIPGGGGGGAQGTSGGAGAKGRIIVWY